MKRFMFSKHQGVIILHLKDTPLKLHCQHFDGDLCCIATRYTIYKLHSGKVQTLICYVFEQVIKNSDKCMKR